MNAAAALRSLVLLRNAFEAEGARPFLVDGTLLGAVRERGFIAHDKDTDFGLFAEDFRPELADAARAAGFTLKHELGTAERGFQWSFVRDRVKTDVFVYYADGEKRYHAAWEKRFTSPIRYEYDAFDLRTLRFRGYTFWAPADPQKFLEQKYGADWRTPVLDWDWAWGPENAMAWVDA